MIFFLLYILQGDKNSSLNLRCFNKKIFFRAIDLFIESGVFNDSVLDKLNRINSWAVYLHSHANWAICSYI
jgi:hypothetical protein